MDEGSIPVVIDACDDTGVITGCTTEPIPTLLGDADRVPFPLPFANFPIPIPERGCGDPGRRPHVGVGGVGEVEGPVELEVVVEFGPEVVCVAGAAGTAKAPEGDTCFLCL